MEVMGWSQVSMTTRYQHVAPKLIAGIAEQVQALLWQSPEAPPNAPPKMK